MDAAEQRALHVTYVVGVLAGVALLVVVCVVCTRLFS